MKKLAELSTILFIIMLIAGCGSSGNDGQDSQNGVSITATQSTAWEDSDDYLEFVIDLGSPNGTSESIFVFFEATGTGMGRVDMHSCASCWLGYVEIPPGSQTATIKIEGFASNGIVEETQPINISLTGCSSADYPIGSSSEATAIIMDGDGETVTDIDGNVYHTVLIGEQTWMVENLNVERYRNGDIIPQVQGDNQWYNQTTGAWCYYNNYPACGNVYGKLYNWHAVNDPRGLAPEGFHIPTHMEWWALSNYLGGEAVAGGKLKDTTLWKSPNTGATNSSGFTALPGGRRDYIGPFSYIGMAGRFWSASYGYGETALIFGLKHYTSDVFLGNGGSKKYGNSIRCVKD
jgi:uncharacterized protein (TIGR02145 family)